MGRIPTYDASWVNIVIAFRRMYIFQHFRGTPSSGPPNDGKIEGHIGGTKLKLPVMFPYRSERVITVNSMKNFTEKFLQEANNCHHPSDLNTTRSRRSNFYNSRYLVPAFHNVPTKY